MFIIQYDHTRRQYRLAHKGKYGEWVPLDKIARYNAYIAFSQYWGDPLMHRVFVDGMELPTGVVKIVRNLVHENE